MSGKKGMRLYPAEVKLEAVRMFQAGKTHGEITQVLRIRDLTRTDKWIRAYREKGEAVFQQSSKKGLVGRPPRKENTQAYIARLEMELALLKKIPYRIARTAARAAQYRSIYHYRTEYPVKAMYAFFGVSRAAYYAWLGKLEQRDRERMEQIWEAYEASHRIHGYRRIALWLRQKQGIVMNSKAVLRLMNKLGIHSRARQRKIYRKLEELGVYHTYPNILGEFLSPPQRRIITPLPDPYLGASTATDR